MTQPTQPPNIIIGTAGHVDHGKTALIERLTGINADRLQEEQERGLTIDLGFAWFQLPSGAWAGIVDVPGHERFVKNMLAGATGIDLFLLVVAADEGVMPQTREHLTILDVLEIEAGIVVITKSDLVDAEMLELVTDDVAEALKGTVFESAPMVTTSATTGAGVDELVARLDEVAASVRPHDIAGPTRMQLDRVFTMKGFGTVVTGSLIRGRLKVDQELEIVPGGLRARVRSLEVYEQRVDEIPAPCRVGVNLAGLGKDELQRGDQLINPGSMSASWMLDVRLRLSPDADRPLAYRERVRIHHGSAELLGRVVLLEGEELAPGQETLAQCRLEAPVAAAAGDHFVIRRYSPSFAIGGGVVLDPTPSRHRRRESEALDRLRSLESGEVGDRARDWTRARGTRGFGAADLASGLQLDQERAERLVEELTEAGALTGLAPGRYLDAGRADSFLQSVLGALESDHAENPLRPAMPTNELQTALEAPSQELLQWALATLRERGLLAPEGSGWRLAEHELKLTDAQERAITDLERRAAEAELTPLSRDDVMDALGKVGEARALLEVAMDRGGVTSVGEFVMSRAALAQAASGLQELYRERGAFGISDVRDLWGSSRKYVVPILEHLDGTGFTRREGNVRHVARAPGPQEGVELDGS